MSLSHLNELPDAALENVVRHLSSKPRNTDWMSFLEPDDAAMAMHPSCPLVNVARSTISTINTWNMSGYDPHEVSLSRKHAALVTDCLQFSGNSLVDLTLGSWLMSSAIEKGRFKTAEPFERRSNKRSIARLRKWMRFASTSLLHLTLDRWRKSDIEVTERMLQTLEGSCVALRRLDISCLSAPIANAVLRATRGRLHELESSAATVPGIGRYCTGLRKLSISYFNARNYMWDEDTCMRNLLRTAGPTLESLEILCGPSFCATEFEHIRELCPNLSRIALYVEHDVSQSAYVDLLCSYGSQLQYAHLSEMPFDLLERLVESCENLRCQIDEDMWYALEDTGVVLERMKILGICVQSIEVGIYDSQNVRSQYLESISQAFCQLEEMRLTVPANAAVSAIKALFSHEMPLLTKFDLSICDRDDYNNGDAVGEEADRDETFGDVSEALLELSAHVGTLRDFGFHGYSQDRGAFSAIARGAPMLQNVRLNFLDMDLSEESTAYITQYQARVEDTVSLFMECPALNHLEQYGSIDKEIPLDRIADACRRLQLTKNRHLSAEVLGVKY